MNENEDVPTVLPVGLSLSAVQTDDALVESLRRETRSPGESELTRLLLAWKRDIEGADLPAQPDLPAAERALASQARSTTRRRLLTPVAAAAAAVVIAMSGVALLAHDSRPGDPLWGVTQVVYADHARSVAAATQAQLDIGLAQRALAAGTPEAARDALARVSAELRAVNTDDGRAALSAQWSVLAARLGASTEPPVRTPAPPVPPAPTQVTTPPPAATVTVPPRPSPVSPPLAPAPRAVPTPSRTPSATPSPIPTTTVVPSPPATTAPTTTTPPTTTTTTAPTATPSATTPGSTPAAVVPQVTTQPGA